MKTYSKLTILPLAACAEEGFLTGSVTKVPVKVNKVEVEEYQEGWAGTEYEDGGFDLNF